VIDTITGSENGDLQDSETDILEDYYENLNPMANHPLLGRWETTNHNEIDLLPNTIERLELFDDGTGFELLSNTLVAREITWAADGGRLTITPLDASFRVTTYEYELSGNTITIFYNINRTSFTEARRMR
jgi:hypothetical protein